MHTVAEVLALIDQQVHPLAGRRMVLAEALNLRLTQGVRMDRDSPPFDRAMVDGYALRAADAAPGARLNILGRQDAGTVSPLTVTAGACIAINTGAPIPAGADAVIMVEDTAPVDEAASPASATAPSSPRLASDTGQVYLRRALRSGDGIQRQGADARSGQEVLTAGQCLGPVQLATAAAAGADSVWAIPAPTVALFATGDELVPFDQSPGPAQIRNTNAPLLQSLIQQAGAQLIHSETLRDSASLLRNRFSASLAAADVLIITGGMSMGTRDLVPQILVELGVTLHVQKVSVKPGKPFLFGTFETAASFAAPAKRKYVLGLPGNPVSALVCFILFGRLLLNRIAGGKENRPLMHAFAHTDLPANGDREFYQPAIFTPLDASKKNNLVTHGTVTPLLWHGSADLFTLAAANALLIHPAHQPARLAGTVVDILLL